jgi:hypothetical protein
MNKVTKGKVIRRRRCTHLLAVAVGVGNGELPEIWGSFHPIGCAAVGGGEGVCGGVTGEEGRRSPLL